MPVALLQAFVTMLPRIQADERLAAINTGAMAAGNLTKIDAHRMKRALEQAARGGKPTRAARPSPAQLGAMGIGLRTVPSTGAEQVLSAGSDQGPNDG